MIHEYDEEDDGGHDAGDDEGRFVRSKEERQEFISAIAGMMLEYGAQDFSDDEKRDLVANS